MRVLLAALGAYMVATGWAGLLAGTQALIVMGAVFIPFAICAVMVLAGQQENHRHERATWARPPDRRQLSP